MSFEILAPEFAAPGFENYFAEPRAMSNPSKSRQCSVYPGTDDAIPDLIRDTWKTVRSLLFP